MARPMFEYEPFLTAGQVAALFNVAPKTVTRWAIAGKIPCRYLPPRADGSRERRYPEAEIRALLVPQVDGATPAPPAVSS